MPALSEKSGPSSGMLPRRWTVRVVGIMPLRTTGPGSILLPKDPKSSLPTLVAVVSDSPDCSCKIPVLARLLPPQSVSPLTFQAFFFPSKPAAALLSLMMILSLISRI